MRQSDSLNDECLLDVLFWNTNSGFTRASKLLHATSTSYFGSNSQFVALGGLGERKNWATLEKGEFVA